MEALNINEIDQAYERIKPFILKTPLITSDVINEICQCKVYFKLENLQWTGSFKLRGATNKILQLSEEQKSKGIIAYSSGNHAQAVSYISNLFGIDAKIVMPSNAPLVKINNTKKYGAQVVTYNPHKETREKIASEIIIKENRTLIKPYNDLDIIAGQGTIGKEIVEELKMINVDPDIYLCCCGGGGLIAGSSTYIKHYFPKINNFSVEPEDFNDTQLSLLENTFIRNKTSAKSICDALLAPQPGSITFPINQNTLTEGLKVSDAEVLDTIIKLAENMKIVVEPGGAVAAAALFYNKINVKNQNVIVMISGGNIDFDFFHSIAKNNE